MELKKHGFKVADLILESDDYDRFEMLKFNRNVEKIKNLTESMEMHGYLSAHPIHCVPSGNGKMKIKAGHHRFTVAQLLHIPIKFVISNDKATIYELEASTNPWSLKDYVTSHSRAGKEDYKELVQFCDETGIPVGPASSMLIGHSAGSGNSNKAIKEGTFKVADDTTHAKAVADVVEFMVALGIKWARTKYVVSAISKIFWADGFNPAILKKKMKAHKNMVEKRMSIESYVEMFDVIYNFRNPAPIPLKFRAEQAARERNAITAKKG